MTLGVQVSVRAAAAAALSVQAAQLLRLPFPIYAMIAAVIVSDPCARRTRQLGWPRLVGTAIGATLGALLSTALPDEPATMALAIVTAMLLCHVLRLGDAARVAGYVCGVVVIDHGTDPWSYGWHRMIETGLGIAVAMLVSLVPTLLRADAPLPSNR